MIFVKNEIISFNNSRSHISNIFNCSVAFKKEGKYYIAIENVNYGVDNINEEDNINKDKLDKQNVSDNDNDSSINYKNIIFFIINIIIIIILN